MSPPESLDAQNSIARAFPIASSSNLCDEINDASRWDGNPRVCGLEFKKVKP